MLNLQPTSKKIKRFIHIIDIIKYNTDDSKGLDAELTELPTSSRSVPLAPVVMTWHGPIKSLLKFVNRQVNWLTWNIAIAGDVPITIVSYITLHLKINIIVFWAKLFNLVLYLKEIRETSSKNCVLKYPFLTCWFMGENVVTFGSGLLSITET